MDDGILDDGILDDGILDDGILDDGSHFVVYKETGDDNYPHIDSVDNWLEYTYNAYSNQNSSIVMNCEETVMPSVSPTG